MSINRGMDKEDVVHIYNGILAIRRNEIVSFAEMWMDLETVIQSDLTSKILKAEAAKGGVRWEFHPEGNGVEGLPPPVPLRATCSSP